ncbi:CDP-alcohol phosphatidyltransferase family protein [Actinomycetospora sp. C-140]
MDLEEYFDVWSRAHGDYDVRSSPLTRLWLRIAHRLATPLVRRRVPPARVTAVGLVGAVAVGGVAALGGRWPLLAAALVVIVALLDGVDGAVAEMTGAATAWGRVLDQLVDRIGDLAMIAGLWALGASGPVAAAAAVVTVLDEAVRSSASAAGVAEAGLVSFAERPTRLLLGGLSFAAAGIVPSVAAVVATVGAAVWLVLSLGAGLQLVINVRRRLLGVPRHGAGAAADQEGGELRDGR